MWHHHLTEQPSTTWNAFILYHNVNLMALSLKFHGVFLLFHVAMYAFVRRFCTQRFADMMWLIKYVQVCLHEYFTMKITIKIVFFRKRLGEPRHFFKFKFLFKKDTNRIDLKLIFSTNKWNNFLHPQLNCFMFANPHLFEVILIQLSEPKWSFAKFVQLA